MYQIHINSGKTLHASDGENLLHFLRKAGYALDAPCGGNGACGKCKVVVNGHSSLACQTSIYHDMDIVLPQMVSANVLTSGISVNIILNPVNNGYLLAFDIGTTTVAGYLLDKDTGAELASESMLNPQSGYGSDVISRIQCALKGNLETLSGLIRDAVSSITESICSKSNISPEEIGVVSIVGNPAMQQLFLGINPQNLATIPFSPIITDTMIVNAVQYLPCCKNAKMLIIPDISGYVGADTVAGVLATGLDKREDITLLVDIGTNGEMVLGNKHRMTACSTAAGPALEGANIHFGMRAAPGAIDHVWSEDNKIKHSVIGGRSATGICGSGLIDAVAVALDTGLINNRGRIQKAEEIDGQRIIHLTDAVYLTQNDIREVQMAKGAIAAGIELMAAHLGIEMSDITNVCLAGAFGSFIKPDSACRIGLLPEILQSRISAVGNAAGSGAKLLACNKSELDHVQQLVSSIEFIELAAAPGFQRCFAKHMGF